MDKHLPYTMNELVFHIYQIILPLHSVGELTLRIHSSVRALACFYVCFRGKIPVTKRQQQ
jgi:hypothetical protein